jgi:hypothetical protein
VTSKNWITDPRTGNHHIDGTPWHKAPRPRRLHRCRPWTIGTGSYGTVYRCACGALRIQGSRKWIGKNCSG